MYYNVKGIIIIVHTAVQTEEGRGGILKLFL